MPRIQKQHLNDFSSLLTCLKTKKEILKIEKNDKKFLFADISPTKTCTVLKPCFLDSAPQTLHFCVLSELAKLSGARYHTQEANFRNLDRRGLKLAFWTTYFGCFETMKKKKFDFSGPKFQKFPCGSTYQKSQKPINHFL